MCGFGGVLNSDSKFEEDRIAKIAKAVAYRGPDSTGLAMFDDLFKQVDGPASTAFFFNRLAIIDLDARSNQPYQDDRYLLLFNGEIYNYRRIRDELKSRGIIFRTSSDTEVLFHSLQVWGSDALLKLNGMFAFFWLNKRDQSFLLARDRTGIKPLYYKQEGESFIFASELNTVARFARKDSAISFSSVDDYLLLQYVPTPNTIFEDVYKLAPGHFINGSIKDLKSKQLLKAKPYWNGYETILSSNERDSEIDLEQLLVKSIEGQLVADVPLGLFLSSGVDSSLLTALINKHFKDRSYNLFTVAFDQETTSDESGDALAYLQGFKNQNLHHHKLIVNPEFVSSRLTSLYDYFDEPFGDPAALLNCAISEKARQHVTVVLSGDGADELFWGYPSYNRWQTQKNQLNRRMPFLNSIREVFRMLPESRVKYTLMNLAEKDPVRLYLNILRPRMFGFLEHEEEAQRWWFLKGLDELKDRDDLASVIDLKSYLPDAMLYKVDRSSMASSLEVRVPYLDNDVINYALKLDLDAKSTLEYQNKAPLKKLLNQLAPHYDIMKPKRGFNFPLQKWLKNEWREMVLDTITKGNLERLGVQSSHYLNIVERFYRKDAQYTTEVWYLLNLVLWHNRFRGASKFK